MRTIALLVAGIGFLASLGALLAPDAAAQQKPSAAQRGPQSPQPPNPTATGPKTLVDALAAAYSNNPTLQAARAQLRAVDENVPQALAGWRPTVVLAGTLGYGDGLSRSYLAGGGFTQSGYRKLATDRGIGTAQATVTQPIYRGGRTRATTNRAENQVMGQRAQLLAQEQTTLTNAVSAYVGVIQARQILQLNINNEKVLTRQLQATNDRFRVGEITRTDVAQAEAALAGATATRQSSEGTVATTRSTYQQIIGYLPPADLVEPQPIGVPIKSQQEAVTIAAVNNPNVVAAEFNDAAQKDAVDVAYSALLPNVSLQGQSFQNENQGSRSNSVNGYQVVANLSVPIYQGGAEYSAVRQARQTEQQARKQLDDARRQAINSAINAWETLVAARATANSTRAQIRANQIALEGTEREAIVGSRTTLDVLNAQQLLLNSQVTLVQNLTNLVNASYSLASSVGRLTARDLNLPVPIYDETAYLAAVRGKWGGTGDYATDQPGR